MMVGYIGYGHARRAKGHRVDRCMITDIKHMRVEAARVSISGMSQPSRWDVGIYLPAGQPIMLVNRCQSCFSLPGFGFGALRVWTSASDAV